MSLEHALYYIYGPFSSLMKYFTSFFFLPHGIYVTKIWVRLYFSYFDWAPRWRRNWTNNSVKHQGSDLTYILGHTLMMRSRRSAS